MAAFSILIVSQPASTQLEPFAMFGARSVGAGLGAGAPAVFSFLFVTKYGLVGIGSAALISATVTAIVNVVAIARYLKIPSCKLIFWITRSLRISALLVTALAICQWAIGPSLHSPVTHIAAMASITSVAFVAGFRILLGKASRDRISNYLSPGMPLPTILIARILGLKPADGAFHETPLTDLGVGFGGR